MGKKSVLIIDDDSDILLELEELLLSIGFICHCATGVVAALKIIDEHPDIALIITDLRMPDQSGLRLIQMLRDTEEKHAIPIIVTSGHADMDDVITLFRNGVIDFLPKPIYYDHLVGLLQRFVPDFEIS